MSKITYTDKVTLNENPNVADVNKVKADDLNEIKNVVNANADNLNKIENQLQNIVIYEGWSQSVSFELPIGRHALVLSSSASAGVLLIWNPPDKVNWNAVFGDSGDFNVSRASNNTTITISRKSGNATWSVFILK